MDALMDVIVVGAGMAGVTYARTVHDAGWQVLLLDKSRGFGGRMATRRSGENAWDHGAQYFTATHPDFHTLVTDWVDDGLAAIWQGRIAVWDGETLGDAGPMIRYVGVPGMTAVCKAMAAPLPHHLHTTVTALLPEGEGWRVLAEHGEWRARRVVLAMPPAQAAALLPPGHDLLRHAANADMLPAWTLLLSFAAPLPLPFSGLFINREPLAWLADNASKPGRPAGLDWVLHASPTWSAAHLDLPHETVAELLEQALLKLCAQLAPGQPVPERLSIAAHRWRYARPAQAAQDAFRESGDGLALIGDWLLGGRVEGAFLSGLALARRHCGIPVALTEVF
ncbi:NAD(P)/FAD-dependent oxidoreductase [Chitinilyticum litopenaei]|uniref:NAD(P)/FAD-dependent oxidoreductase n=1 Tax=Chitinilyticum litopenaei TaxID=1121276 RepID=UPI00040F31AD|nr:FAD-dependent oxidoreductase [Chitinilyticum litopenaei]